MTHDNPTPYEPEDDEPKNLERSVIEQDEYFRDQGEMKMFDLFTEGIEDLYAKVQYLKRRSEEHQPYGKSLQ